MCLRKYHTHISLVHSQKRESGSMMRESLTDRVRACTSGKILFERATKLIPLPFMSDTIPALELSSLWQLSAVLLS